MSRIPPEVIARIREASDIVEVASSGVSMRQSGSKFKGLCPFHEEKTPSFYVDPEKQLYFCFGCQEGGDIFSLIMKLEGVSFIESVRTQASRTGITLPEITSSGDSREFDSAMALQVEAEKFFIKNLESQEGVRARGYLARRGIPEAIIKQYGLGLASKGWGALSDQLKRQNYKEADIVKAGLAVGRRDGKGVYDRFRSRLIIPIRNSTGRVVGFGGRALEDGDEPKYLNSPDSPVFKKGDLLFGLPEARKYASNSRSLVLVEGYFDVLAFAIAGVPAVAPMGTALTSGQARLAGRFADKITLFLDNDEAGKKATLKAFGILGAAGIDARVGMLGSSKDPAELLEASGKEGLAEAAQKTKNIVDFYAESIMKGSGEPSLVERLQVTRTLLPEIRKVRDADARAVYGSYMEERVKVPWVGYGASEIEKPASQPKQALPIAEPKEERLVRALLADSASRKTASGRISASDFITPGLGDLAAKLLENPDLDGPQLATLSEQLQELPKKWLYFLSMDEDKNKGETIYMETYLKDLTEGRKVTAELDRILDEIKDADRQGDKERQERLLKSFEGLQRQVRTR